MDHRLAARMGPRTIRAVVRHVPPRGRGIRLAHTWTRRHPPDAGVFVCREPGGVRLRCDLRDELSRVIFYRGWMDRRLERWMARWLRPGDLYVDVGAHIGYLAALASRAVGPTGRVVAFEPTPDTFAKLSAAFASPRLGHVETRRAAVAAASGETTLHEATGPWENQAYRSSLHSGTGLAPTARVATVALDDLFGTERIRLLKVDVEGGEVAVLEGASRLLSQRRCDALVIELNPEALARAGCSVEDVTGRLDAWGYRAHRADDLGLLHPWPQPTVVRDFADAVYLAT